MKTSEIKFTVSVDEQKIPQSIQWEATDSGIEGKRDCKATMLTVWDGKDNTTLRIDLWTKDMLVDDMKRFFYESFMSMAEAYQRATEDAPNAEEIRKFSESFAAKAGLYKKL